MHTLGKWLGLLAAAGLMASFTAVATAEEPSLEQKLEAQGFVIGEEVRHIRGLSLNGWTHVDDRHFIMRSGVRDNYLISLRARSRNLRSAVKLGFSTTTGSLTNMDRVVLRDTVGHVERINIDKMYVLKRSQADQKE